ncbi:MAG: OsmC family protein [Pseudomonadota bacterium]
MKSTVSEAQTTVRALYRDAPEMAMVTDEARTCGLDPRDPFHSQVMPRPGGGVAVPVGVHHAVGGPYDAPCPGDLLCAALAACQDSTIRMVANLMGIELLALEVHVKATVDVRGAMGIHKDAPVGFQSITCEVHLKASEGTPPEALEKLLVTAERCCVVSQTLRHSPPVNTFMSVYPFEAAAQKRTAATPIPPPARAR